jgi:hypothetical protein
MEIAVQIASISLPETVVSYTPQRSATWEDCGKANFVLIPKAACGARHTGEWPPGVVPLLVLGHAQDYSSSTWISFRVLVQLLTKPSVGCTPTFPFWLLSQNSDEIQCIYRNQLRLRLEGTLRTPRPDQEPIFSQPTPSLRHPSGYWLRTNNRGLAQPQGFRSQMRQSFSSGEERA